MLLLITSSGDGTSDLIVSRLKDKVFRLNFDQIFDFKIYQTPFFWEIENPAGIRINSKTVSNVFWWKAFNASPPKSENFLEDEAKYILRELYSSGLNNCQRKGNPPDFHNHLGKIKILNLASKYFDIPKTAFTLNRSSEDTVPINNRVAKSLSSSLFSGNKVLFTSDISSRIIDLNYPWFTQEKVAAKFDMTCLVVDKELFSFTRSRENLNGLDWRSEQSLDLKKEDWKPLTLDDQTKKRIKSLNLDLNVTWGRHDFMIDNSGNFIFLEFNANGQWVFLDYSNKFGILDAVIEYLK